MESQTYLKTLAQKTWGGNPSKFSHNNCKFIQAIKEVEYYIQGKRTRPTFPYDHDPLAKSIMILLPFKNNIKKSPLQRKDFDLIQK